jgi:hypothetical protein
MTSWTAASTFILLTAPQTPSAQAIPAIGAESHNLFSLRAFDHLWRSFFGTSLSDSSCGLPQRIDADDAKIISNDEFLVHLRGFRKSICKSSAWHVASMRIDPCRIRQKTENKNVVDIKKCSLNGKFSEVRFVLQPVEETDRGPIYPDAAMHVAFSLHDIMKFKEIWTQKRKKPQELIAAVKKYGRLNDVSLFISGGGLERWSFARVVFSNGHWTQDKLAHGGFFESLSDADGKLSLVRTPPRSADSRFTQDDFLNPLRVSPLNGSCLSCHLTDSDKGLRQFRQLGWGLSGEPVASRRLLAEAEEAAKELNILDKQQP